MAMYTNDSTDSIVMDLICLMLIYLIFFIIGTFFWNKLKLHFRIIIIDCIIITLMAMYFKCYILRITQDKTSTTQSTSNTICNVIDSRAHSLDHTTMETLKTMNLIFVDNVCIIIIWF